MLIFLYGPDTFRISRKLGRIVQEYKKRARGLDCAVFDAADISPRDFFAVLFQNSLFGEKKFLIVKNPVSNKELKEALVEKIEDVARSGHNIVFCQEGKVLKADRLLKVLAKHGQTQEFLALEGAQLEKWAAGEFAARGASAGVLEIRALVSRTGNDLWRLSNEIHKLAHVAPGRPVAVADIIKNVAPEIDANIFKTVDAIAGRDKKTAVGLVREHLAKGDHPLYLLAMVAAQFKNLLLVKSSGGRGGAARLGIHPYVFGKTVSLARNFDLGELKNIYREICRADIDIKTGRVSPEAGLDVLLVRI